MRTLISNLMKNLQQQQQQEKPPPTQHQQQLQQPSLSCPCNHLPFQNLQR